MRKKLDKSPVMKLKLYDYELHEFYEEMKDVNFNK